MGLDMYLYATNHMTKYDEEFPKAEKVRKIFPEMSKSENLDTVEVKFEIGYWRKANAIHQWFVEKCQKGVDDCRPGYVNRKKLKELKLNCQSELNAQDNPEESEGQLEPKSGFFFGTYEKDEWYYGALEETIKIIDKCLLLPEQWNFEYCSSW